MNDQGGLRFHGCHPDPHCRGAHGPSDKGMCQNSDDFAVHFLLLFLNETRFQFDQNRLRDSDGEGQSLMFGGFSLKRTNSAEVEQIIIFILAQIQAN